MKVFLCILAFIVLLITAILLLPVCIIIKTDQSGDIIFRLKILFITFGSKSNPDSKTSKTFKKATGVSKKDKKKQKDSDKKINFIELLKDNFSVLLDLLKRLLHLFKSIKIKTLKINIICASDDAAQTAINYGRCYAVISPLLSFLHSTMKVNKKDEQINITCNFEKPESNYTFDIAISVQIFRIVAAVLPAAYKILRNIAKKYIEERKIKNSR